MRNLTRKGLIILVGMTIGIPSFSQADHYEALFHSDDTVSYLSVRNNASDQANEGWRNPGFDDSHWETGKGGVGFGDDDDSTHIPRAYSVYLRLWFSVNDLSAIEDLILLADYDDGFVAYLNGKEIARSMMSENEAFPPYNRRATDSHEAKMYSGGYPELFKIDSSLIAGALVEGNNLMAIQVHNESSGSLDLSSNFFLIAGMNQIDYQHKPLPAFFDTMLDWYSSTLPLIVIDSYGEYIPDEPKIPAWMKIYYNGEGERSSILDEPNVYDGHIAIEQRGNSSRWMHVDDGKISYSLETQDSLGENNNVKLLGMPKENDWVLYGPYSDKTMLKNVLAYWMGNELGAWSPRTRFVDVILNGKQMGIFAFMEKIKRDDDRVDIARLDFDDNAGDSLTGGYIVKIDRNTGNPKESWDSPFEPTNAIDQTVSWVMVYPRHEVATDEQISYIQKYITDFEIVLNGANYLDPSMGYKSWIDMKSFVDFFIVGELFRDADSFRSSMFLHKNRDDKDPNLYMGPLWDFNYSMGNYDVCGCASSSGWAYLFNHYCNERFKINPFWWEKIVEDPVFIDSANQRWNELRKTVLSEDHLFGFIDSTVNYLEPSTTRNFEIWPILDTELWPNYYVGGTYENEIAWMKNWIQERLWWLDENIPLIGTTSSEHPDIVEETEVSIYPNPMTDLATIRIITSNSGPVKISIYNQLGQKVQDINKTIGYPGTWLIPLEKRNLPAGIYHVMTSMNKQILNQQALIMK